MKDKLNLPDRPSSIQKGVPLKQVLDKAAILQLGENLQLVYPDFQAKDFFEEAYSGLEPLPLKERAYRIAEVMKMYLPSSYSAAIQVLLDSLTPANTDTSDLGLAGMFYYPHASFVERYGLSKDYNEGDDPFYLSMRFQYELTKRFTAEFSIRPFLLYDSTRTFSQLYEWMHDPDPHVRRLCSEGTRPRLPWAPKLQFLIEDPGLSIPILEQLKNDPDLYVRRSVANHVGDIAKDHLDFALSLCESWINGASKELKWVIRHAVRYPAKKENERALEIRRRAK